MLPAIDRLDSRMLSVVAFNGDPVWLRLALTWAAALNGVAKLADFLLKLA